MEQHYKALGWIFVVIGILGLIGGVAYGALMPMIVNKAMTDMERQTRTQMGGPGAPSMPGMPSVPGAPTAPGAPNMPTPPGFPSSTTPTPGQPDINTVKGAATGVGVVIILISLVGCGLQIICGWGLLARKAWARILTIVVSVISLIGFPIGTALGIYGLWAMLQSAKPTAWESYVANQPLG
jgi:hypothetical protein